MSETTAGNSELTSHYSAQVAGDLERNLKEQDRLQEEIEALQSQLTALQEDHTVLVNIQQALGVPAAPPQPAPEPETAPAPRKSRTAAGSGKGKQARATKSTASARKIGKKTPAPAPAPASTAPKLVDLVREHLAGQQEPRSAAEVATALQQQHPERDIKTKIVRLTLEGLVARNHAQRTKQGRSVFYTTPETAEPAPQGEPETSQSA
ncbi:hypothetical protein [Streptomyces griseorubiginosus]|uniref:hypothetical protein n=1 Tax=Streptomyces griseorubiginosus TaxID=67304 RepID=UPI001AD76F0A|nr:hypothetical protein [Streptomyces griseorubiginosus]MBO4253669.1 hypothetical protein [Streptomyces griseorubiginosus]